MAASLADLITQYNPTPAGCYSLAGDLVGSYRLQIAAAQFPDCAQYREVEQSGKLVGQNKRKVVP